MARDAGESLSLFEPLVLPTGLPRRSGLNDLALSLAEKSAALASATPSSIKQACSTIIDIADCHYSVTLDGYAIHPRDAEKVVQGLSSGRTRGDTHLASTWATRKWMAEAGLSPSFSPEFVCAVHREFYQSMPPGSWGIKHAGVYRTKWPKPGDDGVSPGAVPRFVEHIGRTYEQGGRLERLLSAIWAHHRFMWVRPFEFGSDTVARFTSCAMMRSDLNAAGLWSVYRALWRWPNVYEGLLFDCGGPGIGSEGQRRGLNAEALADFTEFFLWVCTEEVDWMARSLDPSTLHDRTLVWVRERAVAQSLPPRSDRVMSALIQRGDLDANGIAAFTGLAVEAVSAITSSLTDAGAIDLVEGGAAWRVAITVEMSKSILPGLLPVF